MKIWKKWKKSPKRLLEPPPHPPATPISHPDQIGHKVGKVDF